MKFKIGTVSIWNNPPELCSEYPCVMDFGFESVSITKTRRRPLRQPCDGIKWTSEEYTVDIAYVNIDSLDRLLEFRKAVGHDLILHVDNDGDPSIEIYDNYRE